MRRRVPPAPHGFDINSRVSFLLSLCVLFAARIPDTGHFCPREHNRRAAGGRPLTGFPGVLLITTTAPSKVPWLALFRLRHTVGVEKILVNTSSIHCGFLLAASAPRSEYGKPVTFSVAQSQPPRLTCGANMEYHYPSIPRVMAKQSAGLLVRQKWIARCKRNTANGQRAAAGHPPQVMALSPVSLGGAGMYLLCWIFDCQGTESNAYGCFRAKASRMLWRIQCISAGCEGRRSCSVFSCSLVKYLKVFVGSRAR